MATPGADKSLELARKFLADKTILVVDPGSSSRVGVTQLLVQLGAKTHNCTQTKTLAEAQESFKQRLPAIVITEYTLGKQCGLELLQAQRAGNPDSRKSIFMLLTSNTSQSAVARAAEEDVDAFVLKPFTPEVFKNILIRTAIAKLKPPLYMQEIYKGKLQIETGDFEGANATFTAAMEMDPQPALACYYLGQIRYLKKAMDESRGSYVKGLDFNKIHYRCLVGLYELLSEQKSYDQAYEVVKKISQYFPASPKRLAEVLRLAIINKAYEDVERYYGAFLNIDERNDTLVKYVCAALVVCGKYYLLSNNRSRALELFQKAAVTSAGKVSILIEILRTLVEFRMGTEADKFMSRIPPESRDTPEVRNIDFLVSSLDVSPSAAIVKGRKLIAEGIAWDKSHEAIVRLYLDMNSYSAAEDAAGQAISKYPELKAPLDQLLARHKPSKSAVPKAGAV